MADKYTNSPIVRINLSAILAIPRSELPDAGSAIYPFMTAENTGVIHLFDPDSTTIGVLPTGSSSAGRWIPINREILQANRTYFVRTDGNDSNDGLSNTSSGAFLTATAARNAIRQIDGNGFTVTVQFANGTYTQSAPLDWSGFVGIPTLFLVGNATIPANVTITSSSGTWANRGLWEFNGNQQFDITGFTFTNSQTNAYCARFQNASQTIIRNNAWNTGGYSQIGVFYFAKLEQIGNFTISGSTPNFLYAEQSCVNFIQSGVGTLTGGNYSEAFMNITNTAVLTWVPSVFTWSGSVTGKRYSVVGNSVIQTFGISGNLPGNIAGTTNSGGQYV